MNFRRGSYKEEPEMNLVPLIDVLLVILIFLMVTTTYSRFSELQINLPKGQGEKQLDRPTQINVGVGPTGKIVINRAPVNYSGAEALAAELKRAAAGNPDPVIVIDGDAASAWQSIFRVMEAARNAGFGKITFTGQIQQQ